MSISKFTVCKRKVGPSNHSDSSDSESERPPPSTTTSVISTPTVNAAVFASTTGSSSRDSVPLLQYEQAFGSAGNLSTYSRGNPTTTIPSRPFRSPGFLNLARISSEASGMPPPQRIRPSSIEDSSPPHTPEDEVMRISSDTDLNQDGRRGVPRFFGRVRNFIRRVTNNENPHTLLDNDFASVSEEDIENSSNNVVLQQPIVTSMLSASDRSVILEPLPPQLMTLERRPSEDSEVEVIDPTCDDTNNSSPNSNTPTHSRSVNNSPPPNDPTVPI
jgi:hypothetical protein